MKEEIDWSRPQRQPLSGLLVDFAKSFWQLGKALWPFVLLAIFRNKENKFDFYDAVLILALVTPFFIAFFNYLYFRFYISGDELIVRKGWLKKKVLVIPLQKIQAVHIEQSMLHRLLDIVKLSADTAGSSDTEVTIEALSRPMAEALRQRLTGDGITAGEEESMGVSKSSTRYTLTDKDLWRLSFSANHLEALAILLSFGIGIYENIRTLNEDLVRDGEGFVSRGTVAGLLFLIASILCITLLISTFRIYFKFYGFTLYPTGTGLHIKSGLTNTKERLVHFSKVQYISWRANWIRKQLPLYLLQYHTAGADVNTPAFKIQVPVTDMQQLPNLTAYYYPVPDTESAEAVRVDKAYVLRRTMVFGLLPAFIAIAITWYWWEARALLLFIFPLLVGTGAYLFQKNFRLWAFENVVYIKQGKYGVEKILLQWDRLQHVTFSQSFYQRQRRLATVVLHTASGIITVPFINETVARQLVNYALYKVETAPHNFL